MEISELIFLTGVATLTSSISAIVGMGGGILLLAAMLVVEPRLLIVIPLHGVIQLTSNVTRVFAYRSFLTGWVMRAFALGGLLGVVLAFLFLSWLENQAMNTLEPWLKIALAIFIYSVLLRSRQKGEAPRLKAMGFSFLGVCVVPLSTILGATGPLTAPFFMRNDMVKETVIVNKASCQVITHALKLLAFSTATTFSVVQYGAAIILLPLAAVVGTFLGKWMIQYVSEDLFRTLYRVALTIAATKILVVDGLAQLLQ